MTSQFHQTVNISDNDFNDDASKNENIQDEQTYDATVINEI